MKTEQILNICTKKEKLENEQQLANRFENTERQNKHDAMMLLYGFSVGIQAREELITQGSQSA